MALLDAQFVPYSVDECYAEVVISTNVPIDILAITVGQLAETSLQVLSGSHGMGVLRSNNPPKYGGYELVPMVAARVPDFTDDMYNRVYVIPTQLDFGNILEDESDIFYLWNAHFSSKTFSAIVKTEPENFTLDGETAPYTIPGLRRILYTVTVLYEGGNPLLQSNIEFIFPLEDPDIDILGFRMLAEVFPHVPLLPMRETLEWHTNIITAKDGSEQRICIRKEPRQGFEFAFQLFTEHNRTKFDASLFTWQKRWWFLPVWADKAEHMATITAGDETITVDTTNKDYREEWFGIVWKNLNSFELFKINSFTDSVITLNAPMNNTFTGKKYIMPLRVAQMVSPIQNSRTPLGDGFEQMSVNFLCKYGVELTDYAADVTYNDIPVLMKPAVVKGGTQEIQSDARFTIADNIAGGFDYFSDETFNKVLRPHIFQKDSLSDIWDFRQFLHYLKGQQNVVWIPSWRNDLQQSRTITVGTTDLYVENCNLFRNIGANNLRKHLCFWFPDGSYLFREVESISYESDAEELITIDSPLGVVVNVGDCIICWMEKHRLSDDKVALNWEFSDYVQSEVNFVGVEQ